jgi:DEAD/DEAH box helicase domain-containing protein
MNMLPYAADDRRDGIVGLSFALKQIAQLLLMCDSHDIGISIDGAERDLLESSGSPRSVSGGGASGGRQPRVFVYDNYPGGIGFSRPLFEMHAELIDATRRLISDCECENGCPGCVGPIGDTGPHAKAVALRILGLMTGKGVPEIEAAF